MTKSSTMEAKVIGSGSFLEQPENAPLLPFSNFREIEMKLDISDDRGQPWNRRPRSCRKRKSSSTSTGILHRGRRRFTRPRRSTNRRPSVARTFVFFLIAAAAVATFQVSLDPLSIPFRFEGEGGGGGGRATRACVERGKDGSRCTRKRYSTTLCDASVRAPRMLTFSRSV